MQLKQNIEIEEGKITGIIGNNVDDLIYFEKLFQNPGIYKISCFDYDNDFNNTVGDFIISNDNIEELLKLVDLKDEILNNKFEILSTSEKIKVLIIKGLVSNNKVIFLNNILLELDSKSRTKIFKLIIKLKNFYHKTIIISDINVDTIYELIDNIIIIKNQSILINSNKYDAFDKLKNSITRPLTIYVRDKIYSKNKINIGNNDSINELIKSIYREIR